MPHETEASAPAVPNGDGPASRSYVAKYGRPPQGVGGLPGSSYSARSWRRWPRSMRPNTFCPSSNYIEYDNGKHRRSVKYVPPQQEDWLSKMNAPFEKGREKRYAQWKIGTIRPFCRAHISRNVAIGGSCSEDVGGVAAVACLQAVCKSFCSRSLPERPARLRHRAHPRICSRSSATGSAEKERPSAESRGPRFGRTCSARP